MNQTFGNHANLFHPPHTQDSELAQILAGMSWGYKNREYRAKHFF